MHNHSLKFFILYVCLYTFPLRSQVQIDTSAIGVFWEITNTLLIDKEPSDQLWSKFSNHPAYAQIEKSGNRVSRLKRMLPIVFCPSNSEKLKKVLKGKKSFYRNLAQHLIEVKETRKELNFFLKDIHTYFYQDAYKPALDYLPKDIDPEALDITVHIALFENNGFGGEVITVDLLYLYKNTPRENLDFLSHEFHHAIRGKSKIYTSNNPGDSKFAPLIDVLNKIPFEGVACLIDKSKYFEKTYYLNPKLNSSKKSKVLEFQGLVANAPARLKQIDSILSSDLAVEEMAKEIRRNLPWGGHSIGFHMARTIESSLGKKRLVQTQYSCVEFILLYHEVVFKENSFYTFSDKSIAFLKAL